MKNTFLKLYVRVQVLKDALIRDESGQDLVEYALVVSLIALGRLPPCLRSRRALALHFRKSGASCRHTPVSMSRWRRYDGQAIQLAA